MRLLLLITLMMSHLLLPQWPVPTQRSVRLQAIQRAIAWMHTIQRPNGGFGDCSTTATAVQAIAQAGQNPAGSAWARNGNTPVQALISQNCPLPDDSGVLAKMVLGLVTAGINPRAFNGTDLVARLQAAYDPATRTYHPYSNFRLALVLKALAVAQAPIQPAVLQFVREQQRVDGGWGWPYDTSAEAESEVDTTGRMLEGLIAAAVPANDPLFSRADAYLKGIQQANAAWPLGANSAMNANSTALALAGLVAIGRDPLSAAYLRQGQDPVNALLRFQEASGAFAYQQNSPESRILATLDAINALYPAYPGDHPLPLQRTFPVAFR